MWKAWSEFLIAPTNKNPCFWNNVTDWLTIPFHYKLRTFFGCLCHSSGSSSELSDSDSSSSLELVSISSSLSNISGCPTDSVGTVFLWCVFVFSQFTHSQRDVQAFLFFLQLQRLVLQPLLLHLHFWTFAGCSSVRPWPNTVILRFFVHWKAFCEKCYYWIMIIITKNLRPESKFM